jgi:hypothetical protein
MEVVSVLKTGKLTDSEKFPLTIEIIKTTSSTGKKDIPDGVKLFGHGSIGKMPSIDSIDADDLSNEMKDGIKDRIQSMFAQLNFPEKN